MCEGRLSGGGLEGGVSEHYRAVIRALVAEAIDLASFLQRVAQGKKFPTQASDLLSSEHDLRELQCEDWVSHRLSALQASSWRSVKGFRIML